MKLRNKTTGEIVDTKDYNFKIATPAEPLYGHDAFDVREEYNSLAELNEEWEDAKPAEPLIKDEKIRKAVRVWAEVCGLEYFTVINEHFNCCKIMGRKGNRVSKIEFLTTIPNATHQTYTIAELCGEIDCEPVKEMDGWRKE